MFRRPFRIFLEWTLAACLISAASGIWGQECGAKWSRAFPMWPDIMLSQVTWCGDRFVVLAKYGRNQILESPDGRTWETTTSPEALVCIAFGNGRTVGITDDIFSRCSIWWREGTGAWQSSCIDETGVEFNSIAYGNGQFVAVGAGGAIFTSADGQFWLRQNSGTLERLEDIAFGNGRFVAVLSGSRNALSSVDGSHWQMQSIGQFSPYIVRIRFLGNRFVIVQGGYQLVTSADGITWNQIPLPESPSVGGNLAWDGSRYLSVDYQGAVASSEDLVNWAAVSQLPCTEFGDLLYAGGVWLAAGGDLEPCIAVSKDAVQWDFPVRNGSKKIADIAYGNGLYLARREDHWGSSLNDFMQSSDAATWTPVGASGQGWNGGPWYCGGLFVATGSNNSVYASADGETWETWSPPTPDAGLGYATGMAWGGGLYVAACQNALRTSPDGRSWAKANLPNDSPPTRVAFGDGGFVACGGSTILGSTDGADWKVLLNDSYMQILDILWDGWKYVGLAYHSYYGPIVLFNRPGSLWYGIYGWAPGFNPTRLAFGPNRLAASGSDGSVLISEDGLGWALGHDPADPDSVGILAIAGGPGALVATGEKNTLLVSLCPSVVTPPAIASISKKKSSFQIILQGKNFQENCAVYINGTAWSQVRRDSASSLTLKGGASLKKLVPKGAVSVFQVVNPDSGRAAWFWKR